MAPILKEADVPATAATTTTAPSAPAAKSPTETPTRPQPVPLEIPVTVNGARTLEGSDKREPFAETTQTVLVFPHGAVIRIATPLAPGQLVFLTNEKTKKEVVCQVVKSKSGGSANGYVELQFTEPAPAFWGLRLPGTAPAPAASAPAVPPPSAMPPATKPVVPSPVVAKTPASSPAPPKPSVLPPPAPPLMKPAPPTPPQPVATVTPVPLVSALPPSPAPKVPEPEPVKLATQPVAASSMPLVSVPPPSPFTPTLNAPPPLIPPPAPGPRDYAKEIESLFAVPQAPELAAPKPIAPAAPTPPPPVTASPSTEELKQQAARLQQQLGAMLFTEAPAAPAKPLAPPPEVKLNAPAAEVATKILEIAQQDAAPVGEPITKSTAAAEPPVSAETKPSAPARAPVFSSLSVKEDEVEIPAWLRPLSQNSESVAEPPTVAESAVLIPTPSETTTSKESVNVDSTSRPEAAVFGGQLLSGDGGFDSAAASGSRKGLFIGLAAAVILVASGGAWYYRQSHSSSSPTVQASSAPAASEPASVTPSPAASVASSRPAALPPVVPATATNPAPASTPVPAPVTSAPAETRRKTENRNAAPTDEPSNKPSLGEVHLATPVVRGSGEAHASGESLPAVDAPTSNSGADALNAVARQKTPAAPIPIGGDVKPAQLVKSVAPVYPQMARAQRVTGNVTLDALIDANGDVAQVKVISGPPLLYQAALDAVKQWKYNPAQLDGNPTSMHLTVTVQFRNQ